MIFCRWLSFILDCATMNSVMQSINFEVPPLHIVSHFIIEKYSVFSYSDDAYTLFEYAV
jgi:hypothetical protein